MLHWATTTTTMLENCTFYDRLLQSLTLCRCREWNGMIMVRIQIDLVCQTARNDAV